MLKKSIPVIILAIGVAVFVLLRFSRPEPPEVMPQERSWRVDIINVELGTHRPLLPLYGEITAPELITITSSLAGRISERPVQEGQTVSEGDLLVALDAADIEPVLARAEAAINDLEAQRALEEVRHRNDQAALRSEQAIADNAQRQLERTQALVQRNLASREALELATDAAARAELTVSTRQRAIDEHPARVDSLEARLAEARANLNAVQRDAERARFRAPFDGTVTDVQVAAGDRVNQNEPLLSLYPTEGLELRARVPEVFRAELQQSLAQGDVLVAEAVDAGHQFRLLRFAGTSDAAGTEAILELTGGPDGLRPGVLLPVVLERAPRANTVAIPFSALYGADSVYLLTDDNRMQRATVTRHGETRSATGERRLLVSGDRLVNGARLITTHLPNAMTGLKVEPVEAGAPAP
ncbi:MAG: biotin/lipoyl-binding protein [Pseudomonadota bacterium]|nr:biotin/lipoyl-binding protein [Pseudomonadota bacterium]